jgi:hypothetical protein
MHASEVLVLTTIILAAGAGIVIWQRRGDGWRRIVVVALLVRFGFAGVMVLWALIAAVAGQKVYFGTIQLPLSALSEVTTGIALVAPRVVGVRGVARHQGGAAHRPGGSGIRRDRPCLRRRPLGVAGAEVAAAATARIGVITCHAETGDPG